MAGQWTTLQVLELAPDAGSAKSGQDLAKANKWTTLGRSDRAVWGEIKGSGAKPYQTRIDLSEPAFKCSCPSRKFPCKHGLALFLIYADSPKPFAAGDPPAWVADWLAERDKRQTKKVEKKEPAEIADPAAQARRMAQREAKVAAGIEELSVWLSDVVRQGLAAVQTRPASFWDEAAARMVDAQAPGLARQVRLLASLAVSGEAWQQRLLAGIGRLHLLLDAYRRLESLPEDLQLEARTAVGWAQSQEEVMSQPAFRDRWLVLGQRVEEEDRLRVRRTWLWGRQSNRPALLLAFAAGGQPLEAGEPVATEFNGEMVFYPGSLPLRALVKSRTGTTQPIKSPAGAASIDTALANYAESLKRCPWLASWPMALNGVVPHVEVSEAGRERWWLVDSTGSSMAIAHRFQHGWPLLAVSGGEPIGVFGEWDGERFEPWSVWSDARFFTLVRSEESTVFARMV